MNEQECLSRMVPPSQKRPNAYRGGIIQIWVTRTCDKSCFGCTQGSNLVGRTPPITLEQFEQACVSLKNYFGVVGVFGGNPCLHKEFPQLCEILRTHIPYERRGLWCNKLFGHGKVCRETFNPAVSNLNVHLDIDAYKEFKQDWPEAVVVGINNDSRHSPPYVAMKDVLKKKCSQCDGALTFAPCGKCNGTREVYDEETAWKLISQCDINQKWSAMIAPFRGELRGYFCEIAGAQSILHQHEPDYPDTGMPLNCDYWGYDKDKNVVPSQWWEQSMDHFKGQVRKHCHDCGVPLRGKGELAMDEGEMATEQCSQTHAEVYKPKRSQRPVQLVTSLHELEPSGVGNVTEYLQNARS